MSRDMTKPATWLCAQRRLRSTWASVWPESLLSAWWNLGLLPTHRAHSEDADQIGRMPKLIWVFAARTLVFVGFVMSWLILNCNWRTQIQVIEHSFFTVWNPAFYLNKSISNFSFTIVFACNCWPVCFYQNHLILFRKPYFEQHLKQK